MPFEDTTNREIAQLDSLMQTIAELKHVPMSKVLRNAARDISATAQKTTRKAEVTKSSFWLITDKSGKKRWINRAIIPKRKTSRRWKHHKNIKVWRKLKIGYAKASWIRIMQLLGIRKASSRYGAAMANGIVENNLTQDDHPFVRMINGLNYIKKLNDEDNMIGQGITRAQDKILKGLNQISGRILRKEGLEGIEALEN